MSGPFPPEPEIDVQDEALLVAFIDGQLPADQRAAVQARLDREPELAAAVARRHAVAATISAAVAETGAPHDLRLRIDALRVERPARVRRRWLPFAGLAGSALAAVVAAIFVVAGEGLDVRAVVQAAVRPPLATVALDPVQPRLLAERVEHVRFPNFAAKFGWQATGARGDEIDGRRMRTVFYDKAGRRIAYTIVAGEALADPPDARRTNLAGVELRTLRKEGRTVVTWRRQGRTCVLSGPGIDGGTLRELAAWKAQGDVKF